jgi:uncharacterized membrane-anchored protein YitT (DUF2179 family)
MIMFSLDWMKSFRDYFMITVGLALSALGWKGFLIPMGIVAGGITGVATLIYLSTGFPVGVASLMMKAVLILLAVKIIGSSWVVLHSLEMMVYGFLTMAVLTYVLDIVITGTKQTVQIFIISRKHKELADAIITQANRGVTILDGRGGFTGDEVKVLMVLARKRDSVGVLRIIKHLDPEAFITLGNVMGVYGKGFDTMRL